MFFKLFHKTFETARQAEGQVKKSINLVAYNGHYMYFPKNAILASLETIHEIIQRDLGSLLSLVTPKGDTR